MAKLSAHGTEIARFVSGVTGALHSVREDGTTLAKNYFDRRWRVRSRKKAGVPLAEWRAKKLEIVAAMPAWQRDVNCLPTEAQLREWLDEGVCETPSGDIVEPDGVGPDGAPSWLRLLHMI